MVNLKKAIRNRLVYARDWLEDASDELDDVLVQIDDESIEISDAHRTEIEKAAKEAAHALLKVNLTISNISEELRKE